MTTEKQEQQPPAKTVPPPRLRFKQFEGQGEWEEKRLGEVFTFLGNNSLSRERLNYNSGEVKNIHYGDIHTRFASHLDVAKEEIPFITQQEDVARIKPGNFIQIGDVVIADASEDMADIGKSIEVVSLDDQKLVAGLHTILARPKTDTFTLGFPGHLFKSESVRRQIQKESQGAKVLGLSANRLASVSLTFPPLPEQTHIAAALSSLDDLITAHTDKLEALRQHKRGLMQGLFPAEGERVPRLRFPEFAGAGEWEEKRLGEVTRLLSVRNKKQEKLPIYSISNVGGFVPQSEQFEGVDSHERGYDTSLYKVVEKETFAYNPARINVGSIGYSGNLERVIVSSLYVCFKTTEEINDIFLFTILKSEKFIKIVNNASEGGIRSYFFYDKLESVKLRFPTLPEQQRIAATLSSLDDLITAQADKIAALQEFKRGLMQGLFPSTTAAAQEAGK
ncbi:restriction endonuclease subunit S [Deinococcus sp. Marseille-Q6407]|uniref:restriction endonuclease subunit S n=1 Tax=Deinococcus sp. Marseille-Q6407 TaxID=2969223 RepID=UPI0021C21AD9|nr:restriction endonuclease subunit S [Deinococcus sp. Marseille-Q6407]